MAVLGAAGSSVARRGLAGFSVNIARRICAGRSGAQTPSSKRTYRDHPTLLLFGPDHRTAARVGKAM